MKILALEFSSVQRSVAVAQGDADAASLVCEAVETGAGGPGAFEMIQSVLQAAKLEREQIDCLAVGLGPGSYTGIRVALAMAQGWQLATEGRRVKLLGISSVECLAAQAHTEKIRGPVNAVIDAQRNEVYLATYEISAAGWKEIEPLQILPRAEIESRARANEILIGPEISRWIPGGRNIYPRAARLARLAVNRNDFKLGEKLEPIYLREVTFVKAPPSRSKAS